MNLWRLGNAFILLSSLLLPWIAFWSDIDLNFISYSNGFDILFSPQSIIRQRGAFEGFLPGQYLQFLGGSMLEALVPLIAIGYSIYCIFAFFNHAVERSGFVKRFILALIILVLTLYPLWYISYGIGFNTGLAWGYYVVVIGFISSILLELFSIFRTRYNQKDSIAI